jgi:hypothetical protein
MAHMVTFFPADQVTIFQYSTISVIQKIPNSAHWRPRWSHEYGKQVFEIKLIADTSWDLQISNVYPSSLGNSWRPSGARLVLDERYSSFRVVELLGEMERFFISFGVLDGKNMPWCHVSTESGMNANGIWTPASISEFSHDQNVITDRASKRLQRNQLVIATARPGPYTDIEYQG